MTEQLSWEAVLSWRVARQGLAERAAAEDWLDVVRRICGLHAQVQSSAELTLWARVDGLDAGTVTQALWDDRTLVRTWAMRGAGRRGGRAPRRCAARRGRARKLRDDAQARRLARRRRVRQAGRAAGALHAPGPLAGCRLEAGRAGARGDGGRRAPPPGGIWTGVAETFARWFGMSSAAQAGRLIAALGDEVAAVSVDGWEGWMLRDDVAAAGSSAPSGVVSLLPAFDGYVVAAPREGTPVLAAEHKDRVYRRQGWLSPVLLVDGRIAGVWSHERKGGFLGVAIEPFGPVGEVVREGADREARRLAEYFGDELELGWD